MKFTKKIIISISGWLLLGSLAFSEIDKIENLITASNFEEKSTISVSIKDASTGNVIFRRDDKKFMHPASQMKIFSLFSAVNLMGENYKFATEIFEHNGDIFLKLGGDPLFSRTDLEQLIKKLAANTDISTIKKIYIDDTIIDSYSYPMGWGSDDIYPYEAILSPYILNKNKHTMKVFVSEAKDKVYTNDKRYQIINHSKTKTSEKLKFSIVDPDHPNVFIKTIFTDKDMYVTFPVGNPKKYFIKTLLEKFNNIDPKFSAEIGFCRVPSGATLIASMVHSLRQMFDPILCNSDNFVSETVFKVSGKFVGHEFAKGTTISAVAGMINLFKHLGVDTSEIQIMDGSGRSRYNLVTANWVTDALIALDSEFHISQYLCTPGIGSLRNRLKEFPNKVFAKTGTMRGVVGLCGFIESLSGKKYVFCVMISNFMGKKFSARKLIDDIVEEIIKS